jgi:hypothetical protein
MNTGSISVTKFPLAKFNIGVYENGEITASTLGATFIAFPLTL